MKLHQYNGKSKVLQYFNTVKHTSAASYSFAKVVKIANLTEMPDTLQVLLTKICLYGLDKNFRRLCF